MIDKLSRFDRKETILKSAASPASPWNIFESWDFIEMLLILRIEWLEIRSGSLLRDVVNGVRCADVVYVERLGNMIFQSGAILLRFMLGIVALAVKRTSLLSFGNAMISDPSSWPRDCNIL